MMQVLRMLFIGVFAMVFCSGCIFSDWYHIQMLLGNTEPRPFPMIRFWSEYSSENFKSNVLHVPFAVPFIVPIGYVGDLCFDTLFFPIDRGLSYFSTEPTTKVESCRNGRYTITVQTERAQFHEDESLLKGCVPLTVYVQSGGLSITMRAGTEEKSTILITPQRIISTRRGGYTECKAISQSQPLVLMCQPPHYGIPVPLLPSLLAPYKAAPDVGLSISTEEGVLHGVGHAVSMYRQSLCLITITPSSDFVGECSYNGMPITEVRFVYD